MPSFELEPDKFFSQQEWTEIAQTIGHKEIPQKAKQKICDVLFEYRMMIIKPEKLDRFVEEARKFRAAASRVQNFLRNFAWHESIEELIEEIFQVQKFLDREFKRRSNPKGARPKSVARDTLVYHLGLVYMDLTDKVPSLTVNPNTNELSQRFPDFLRKIFEFQSINPAGLKHAIVKARQALMPKNP